MSSGSMVSVSIAPRGKKIAGLPKNVSTYQGAPASEIISILSKKTKLSANRLKLSDASGKALAAKDTIDGDSHLTVKDLGPQISWRTVFVIEYLGPLLIHPLIFFLYSHEKSSGQYITLLMIVLHFLKREYETIFVHRFSSETMPLSNLFRNCAYYWIVGGASLAAVTYSGWYSEETYHFPRYQMFAFVISELSNLKTHQILRDLRPAGTTERKIPRGLGFDYVSCPNYLFEIIAWCSISAVTNSLASWLFAVVGAVQMWFWSVKKHKRYLKEFKDYPKERKI